MSWNYRMIRDIDGSYGICEVYYTEGEPTSWTDPVDLVGESPDEVGKDLDLMREALKKPILRVVVVTRKDGPDQVLREVE